MAQKKKKKQHTEEGYMPFKDYFKKKKNIIIEEFNKGGSGKGKSRGHDNPKQQGMGNAVLQGNRDKR